MIALDKKERFSINKENNLTENIFEQKSLDIFFKDLDYTMSNEMFKIKFKYKLEKHEVNFFNLRLAFQLGKDNLIVNKIKEIYNIDKALKFKEAINSICKIIRESLTLEEYLIFLTQDIRETCYYVKSVAKDYLEDSLIECINNDPLKCIGEMVNKSYKVLEVSINTFISELDEGNLSNSEVMVKSITDMIKGTVLERYLTTPSGSTANVVYFCDYLSELKRQPNIFDLKLF